MLVILCILNLAFWVFVPTIPRIWNSFFLCVFLDILRLSWNIISSSLNTEFSTSLQPQKQSPSEAYTGNPHPGACKFTLRTHKWTPSCWLPSLSNWRPFCPMLGRLEVLRSNFLQKRLRSKTDEGWWINALAPLVQWRNNFMLCLYHFSVSLGN